MKQAMHTMLSMAVCTFFAGFFAYAYRFYAYFTSLSYYVPRSGRCPALR